MTALTSTEKVRRQNTHSILQVLRKSGQISRTHIAEQTGLSPATVSTISGKLIQQRILQNAEEIIEVSNSGSRGRPRVTLSLNPQAGCIVTMQFSINSLSAQIIDYTGKILRATHETMNSHSISEPAFQELLIRVVNQLISQESTPAMPLRFISIGIQGVVDSAGTKLLWSPITSLHDLPLTEILWEAFRVPAIVANDGNLIANALHWLHPDSCGENFAAIILAQGVGMGLILNGQPFCGRNSSAGEFGHIIYLPEGDLCGCGQRGCIEAYASNYAIMRKIKQLPPNHLPLTAVEAEALTQMIEIATQQDGNERQAFKEAGRAIGYGLRSLFALIDPVPIVLVSDQQSPFDLLKPEIKKTLQQVSKMFDAQNTPFMCFDNARELTQKGCALAALRGLDEQFSLMG